jgi:hypothetical protein
MCGFAIPLSAVPYKKYKKQQQEFRAAALTHSKNNRGTHLNILLLLFAPRTGVSDGASKNI